MGGRGAWGCPGCTSRTSPRFPPTSRCRCRRGPGRPSVTTTGRRRRGRFSPRAAARERAGRRSRTSRTGLRLARRTKPEGRSSRLTATLGIHHVTAIASDPQRTLDFYAGGLGLRLIKRTVNFDDPETYHFYFGDEAGTPGSILTFFPWPGARSGRQGPGQVAVVSFAVLPAALGFWLERLVHHGIRHDGPARRGPGAGGEQAIAFRDHDGLMLELVADPRAEARPAWGKAPGIPREHAIRGFHSVTIWVEEGAATERVLVDTLGFRPAGEAGSTRRFAAGDGGPGTPVDVRSAGGVRGGGRGGGGGGRRPGHPGGRAVDRRVRGRRRWGGNGTPRGVARGGRCGAARGPRAGHPGRIESDSGRRPQLFPLGVFPRAGRRAVRAGHRSPGVRHRRAARAARRAADAPGAGRGDRKSGVEGK